MENDKNLYPDLNEWRDMNSRMKQLKLKLNNSSKMANATQLNRSQQAAHCSKQQTRHYPKQETTKYPQQHQATKYPQQHQATKYPQQRQTTQSREEEYLDSSHFSSKHSSRSQINRCSSEILQQQVNPSKLQRYKSNDENYSRHINNNRNRDHCEQASTKYDHDPKNTGFPQHKYSNQPRHKQIGRSGAVVVPLLQKGEYEVIWESGSLGLSLASCPNTGLLYVKRIVEENLGSEMLKVRIGDTLVLINEKQASGLSIKNVIEVLRNMEKPVVLRFSSLHGNEIKVPHRLKENASSHSTTSPLQQEVGLPDRSKEYKVIWEEGPLGITLAENNNGCPYVRRLTGQSTSKGIHLVHVGDELILMDDLDPMKFGFDRTINFLKASPKPLVLRFKPKLDGVSH